jgi:hypothetical protein
MLVQALRRILMVVKDTWNTFVIFAKLAEPQGKIEALAFRAVACHTEEARELHQGGILRRRFE